MKPLSLEIVFKLLGTQNIPGSPKELEILCLRVSELVELNGQDWIREHRQNLIDEWTTDQHFRMNSVDFDRGPRNRPPGIDLLFETLVAQQTTVDQAKGPDRYDFIAFSRIQSGGFHIKYGIGQIG